MNRCKDCKWWANIPEPDTRYRYCDNKTAFDIIALFSNVLVTNSDFGCVQFEPKS